MAADSIEFDAQRGLILIPPGDPQYVIAFAIWDDSLDAYRNFAQRSLTATDEILKNPSFSSADAVLPVVVSLVPRPDNNYNSDAVSVAAPPSHGGDIFDRHMGYMYDSHLEIRGAPIQVLAASEESPIGCHGFLELSDSSSYDDEYIRENSVIDRDNPFSAQEAKTMGYDVGRLRLNLPYWRDLCQMVATRVKARQPHHIFPFAGHRAAWLPGARDDLVNLDVSNPLLLDLRIEGGALYASFGDLDLAKLAPGSRDFFDRTLLQVEEFGGHATARAEFHRGSLTVFVEDSRPL